MSELLRIITIMSISGSIVAVLLFALKPLVRHRLPKSVQYYAWLVVVATLIIPVSVFFKIPESNENASAIMSPSNVVERYFITSEEEMDRMGALESYGARDANNPIYIQAVKEAESPISAAVTFLSLIYPLGVLIALLYYIINYYVFVRLYRRRNTAATADEVAMLAEMCESKQTPILHRNPLAATPMLIGIFRPEIILPDREYTDEQLRAVLLHELTHLRRGDVPVKWLSVLVTALHWFNPIAWLVRREIDRSCELSCDEVVIRNLDTDGKQNYGETLLYVAADSKTPHAVLSTTMCEEKKALKERLGAIIESKKHTRLTIIISAVLIIAICGTAIALGAGRMASNTNRNLLYLGINGFTLGDTVKSDMTASLTPVDKYSNEYDHNYEDVRFSLDNETEVIRKLWVNVFETGVICSLDDTTTRSPWTNISMIRGYFGEGRQGWQDRGQNLRYVEYVHKEGELTTKIRFVYTDDDYDRLVWVIAETDVRYPQTVLKAPDKTPLLDVSLVTVDANGNSQTQISRDVRAAQLTNDWYVVDENGNGFGYNADSFHPLQKQDGYGDVTLNLNNSGVITLLFSDNYPPQSVSVQRWNAEYAGTDSADAWDKGEPINVTSNTIQISDDGNDYIYEVYATWSEGDSWYVFRIDSENPASVQSPNTYLPQLIHKGIVYYLSGLKVDIEIELTEDAPRIMSVVPLSQLPSENGQANFGEVDNPYTIYGEGLLVRWNNSWEYFVPIELLGKESSALDVSMLLESVSSGGLSFVFDNRSENEYMYGSGYGLFIRRNDAWEAVEPIIENWAFTDEGYTIFPKSATESTAIDWRWLYGELPYGDYLFQKTVLFIRQPGDYDKYVIEKEFTLP